jgi:RNA polymerase sigma-70 factor, ECF subfamily
MRVLSLRQPGNAEDLLVRLQRGEPAAVGELYDAHHEALRAFARRLLGEDAAAEDLVHEVFVQVPKVITRFRGDSSLRSFLIGIAVNHARHHVRSAQRRRAALERLGKEPHNEPQRPDQNAHSARFLRRLQAALDELPLDQRVAFVLCDVEERSSREVAQIAGAPEATIRTRLHHARKKLREVLTLEDFQ